MANIRIAQVGCGSMGLRHLYGHTELRRITDSVDLVAVCDLDLEAAERVAAEAENGLGKRPNVYASFDEMLDREKGLDAVDIVTDPGLHHVFALKALEAGLHVAVEKPMALTVRACRRMMEAAQRSGRYISVFENYRRDPLNRLVKAILDSGAIGDPRLMVNVKTWGTTLLPQTTRWRHLKRRGIYLLEYGVHNADLFLYLMGKVDSVYAQTNAWDVESNADVEPLSPQMAETYDQGGIEDDMALAVIKFESGAMGHFAMSLATPGETTLTDKIYCSGGSIRLPGSRSGRPARVTKIFEQAPLSESQALELVPRFQLDGLTAPFFQSQHRVSSYDMVFEEIDRKLLGLELWEFATAILDGRDPEVTGKVGLDAVALVYAILESAKLGAPVSFEDVVEDQVNSYQQETNEHIGL